ncbi:MULTISPECIES: GntR family transcriptional regulator [Rhodococcus]|uniref:GntR family transcriptional regulator n=2 Tax=Rhodococcus TaxID=1827 RepID=M2XZG2_9NOCA|nr:MULTISPECIES: GntR family transcriptional regulator [Rhodococcus]EME66276.1 GntR family transcriptional regulator [Rhodococcus ruber BKS 20-38]KOS55514.1 GntR family transcriptional regulator [Rhodococcus rhodochrous KG-21]
MAAPARAARSLRRRPQLSEEVAIHLRGLIISGALRSGDFVRLDETAAELGVSVTPVREALLTLRGEGLVESVPNRGYVVSPLGRGDVTDIFWLQERIAVELAVRVLRVAEPEDLDRLTALNDELRRAVSSADADWIAAAEFEFHREVNRIADSPKLAWFLYSAARYTPYRLYTADPEWGRSAVDSHARLIDAFRRGDRDEVIAQTAGQFDDAVRRLLEHLDRRPD